MHITKVLWNMALTLAHIRHAIHLQRPVNSRCCLKCLHTYVYHQRSIITSWHHHTPGNSGPDQPCHTPRWSCSSAPSSARPRWTAVLARPSRTLPLPHTWIDNKGKKKKRVQNHMDGQGDITQQKQKRQRGTREISATRGGYGRSHLNSLHRETTQK